MIVAKPVVTRVPVKSDHHENNTLKKIANEIPCVISGITTGKNITASRNRLPGKLVRASAIATIVPKIVEMTVAMMLTKRLFCTAAINCDVEKLTSVPTMPLKRMMGVERQRTSVLMMTEW